MINWFKNIVEAIKCGLILNSHYSKNHSAWERISKKSDGKELEK